MLFRDCFSIIDAMLSDTLPTLDLYFSILAFPGYNTEIYKNYPEDFE
ncbi:MAG: hypothetical protein IJ590_02935 [Rickettsiales bacterium]|nr:hypothetical protein [Rickettsiales bacterium]